MGFDEVLSALGSGAKAVGKTAGNVLYEAANVIGEVRAGREIQRHLDSTIFTKGALEAAMIDPTIFDREPALRKTLDSYHTKGFTDSILPIVKTFFAAKQGNPLSSAVMGQVTEPTRDLGADANPATGELAIPSTENPATSQQILERFRGLSPEEKALIVHPKQLTAAAGLMQAQKPKQFAPQPAQSMIAQRDDILERVRRGMATVTDYTNLPDVQRQIDLLNTPGRGTTVNNNIPPPPAVRKDFTGHLDSLGDIRTLSQLYESIPEELKGSTMAGLTTQLRDKLGNPTADFAGLLGPQTPPQVREFFFQLHNTLVNYNQATQGKRQSDKDYQRAMSALGSGTLVSMLSRPKADVQAIFRRMESNTLTRFKNSRDVEIKAGTSAEKVPELPPAELDPEARVRARYGLKAAP